MAHFRASMWVDIVPTSGTIVNVPVSDSGTTLNLCVNNSGLLLALTFVFPITGVQDGQTVVIFAKNAITTVTTNVETGGLVQGVLGSLIASGGGIYRYRLANQTWYKVPGV